MRLRDARATDIEGITRIYTAEVENACASYEFTPPSPGEMHRRWVDTSGAGYPFLVAEYGPRLAGYAYASAYRTRAGYRFTVEDSVYVDGAFRQRGVGHALLAELIVRCTRLGFRQMIAVIGDGTNTASVAMHEKHGFRVAGRFPGVGWKHGRWLEGVQMSRPLGDGSCSPPGDPGALPGPP